MCRCRRKRCCIVQVPVCCQNSGYANYGGYGGYGDHSFGGSYFGGYSGGYGGGCC